MNTKFNYLYRDACNYKQHNEVVLLGEVTEQMAKEIYECCDGEHFIPEQIGLPVTRFEKVTEYDHCYCELNLDFKSDFEPTEKKPDSISAEELVLRFKKAKADGWDDVTYAVMPYEDEDEDDEDELLVDAASAYEAGKRTKNMSDREIIIRIPEDKYDRLVQQMRLDRNFNECEITELGEHGDLIDRQALINNGIEKGLCDWYDEIKYADTIIKAHHSTPVDDEARQYNRD